MSTLGFRAAGGLGVLALLAATAPVLPRPAHVVIVIEENRSLSSIIGSESAPYINALAARGALFANFYALVHPSQPNYLAFYSGSTQGVTDDEGPHTFSGANLGSELLGKGLTFTGYSEDLPYTGFTGDSYGAYARKHAPWVSFSNLSPSLNMPFASNSRPVRTKAKNR